MLVRGGGGQANITYIYFTHIAVSRLKEHLTPTDNITVLRLDLQTDEKPI